MLVLNQIREISTNKNYLNSQINPWYITGITDGDGNFSFSIIKTRSTKNLNWNVLLNYNLTASDNPANLKMLK